MFRRLALICLGAWATAGTAAARPGALQYLGVNLAGLEFGIPDPTNGGTSPGTYGQDYGTPTHAEIDYYAALHLNIVRLPFSWERLQPVQNGPFDAAQLAHLDDVVHYAATRRVAVVVDPHNYGFGYGHLIGSPGTPAASFAGLWFKLAAHYATQRNVIFGLMNEPHLQAPEDWVEPVNQAIAAIRATGAAQEILVPGTAWEGGWSWISSGNAERFAPRIVDPRHNIVFEIHQYSDADKSGTSDVVVSRTIAAERLAAVTDWAGRTGNRLFLGEFGAGADADSIANLTDMLRFMQRHAGVWQGGTEWAGGPLWHGHGIDPDNGVTKPQVATLATFAPRR